MLERKFNYGSRKLEVRAIPKNDHWTVRVYENGNPANGVTYSVSNEDVSDSKVYDLDLVDELMQTALNDFCRWSDVLKKEG